MACLFGHKWDGCKCTKCGKTRDEGHDWDLCKGVCKICGQTRPPEHEWNGCVCARCGATRDEGHDFVWKPEAGQCKEVCAICGKFGETKEHDWQPASSGTCMEQCSRCGKTRKNHRFKPVEGCCKEVCAVCGEERALPHQYKPVDGVCKEKCSVCGKERKLEHTFKWKDCTETCTVCGYSRPAHRWHMVGPLNNRKPGCRCMVCGETNENGVHNWESVTEGGYTNIAVCRICGKRDESKKISVAEIERADREMERIMERNDAIHDMAAKGFRR